MYGQGHNSKNGENRQVKFRESTQADIDALKGRSISRGIMKRQQERNDYCYTLEHKGEVLVIGGIRMINNISAWAWVDISIDAKPRMRTVYRAIKEWMEIIVKEKGIIRLQAYIEPDFPEAIRMIQHLGFEKESILEYFLPKGDAYLYRRIFKENI